jgi:hypothetical protein
VHRKSLLETKMEDDQGERASEKDGKRLGGLRALCRARLFIYFCFWVASALHTLDAFSLPLFSFTERLQAAAGTEEAKEAKDGEEVKETEEEEEEAVEEGGRRKRNTEGIVVGRRPRLIVMQACGTRTREQCECGKRREKEQKNREILKILIKMPYI